MRDLEGLNFYEILPSSIASDPNVQALAVPIDSELHFLKNAIPEVLILPRIDELPEPVVDLLAWQYHVDFYDPDLTLDIKRKLVKDSIPWHRKKGTLWAVKKVLDNLGFVPTIKEWFELPPGVEPHTFSVQGYYKDDPNNVLFLGKNTEGLLIDAIWMAKPERSHLLHLVVVPPPPDYTNHLHRWDYCTWDHGRWIPYKWGDMEIDDGICPEAETLFGIVNMTISSGIYVRGRKWDSGRWEYGEFHGIKEQISTVIQFSLIIERDDIFSESGASRRKWNERCTWRKGTWRERSALAWFSTDIFFTEME
jgi:phage tail P2-like protein